MVAWIDKKITIRQKKYLIDSDKYIKTATIQVVVL